MYYGQVQPDLSDRIGKSRFASLSARKCAIFSGLLLTLFASTQLWLSGAVKSGKSEPAICRFWLCPIDPEIARGFERYFESTPAETPMAVEAFRQILTRDPASSYRWCDLGEALLEAGESASASYCFQRANQLAPNSAHILLRAANFWFRLEDFPGALQCTKQILAKTAEYDNIVFSTFDRMGVPVDQVLQSGIPAERRSAAALLRHLIAVKNAGDSLKVWEWAQGREFLDDALAADFVNFLLLNGRQRTALSTWVRYLGRRAGGFPASTLLFNGDFETPLTHCLLDWQIDAIEGVHAGTDSALAYSGKRAMKIQFGGQTNLTYHHVWQVAVLDPGIYRFTAYLKTEEITTDQGAGLHVYDYESPERLNLLFPALTGSHDWMRQEEVFRVGPQTRAVRIELMRLPSKKFDSKIAGSVWLDAVSLQRQ